MTAGIVATGSVRGFFDEMVGDALRARQLEASIVATSYLVELLADYTRPQKEQDEALHQPLTLQLEAALTTPEPADRFERLRVLGDTVLYATGFFGDHFDARGIDRRYVLGIGTRAYGTASAMLRTSSSTTSLEQQAQSIDLFAELAERFEAFVSVLREIADVTLAGGAAGSQGLLRVYERWLKTGSDRLAVSLTEHGLIPTRPVRGVQ